MHSLLFVSGELAHTLASGVVDAERDITALAQRVAEAADLGRFDVGDLGRRARRLLESTARPAGPESLF